MRDIYHAHWPESHNGKTVGWRRAVRRAHPPGRPETGAQAYGQGRSSKRKTKLTHLRLRPILPVNLDWWQCHRGLEGSHRYRTPWLPADGREPPLTTARKLRARQQQHGTLCGDICEDKPCIALLCLTMLYIFFQESMECRMYGPQVPSSFVTRSEPPLLTAFKATSQWKLTIH